MNIEHLDDRAREAALGCVGVAFHEEDEGGVVDGFLDLGARFGGEETGACEGGEDR